MAVGAWRGRGRRAVAAAGDPWGNVARVGIHGLHARAEMGGEPDVLVDGLAHLAVSRQNHRIGQPPDASGYVGWVSGWGRCDLGEPQSDPVLHGDASGVL